MTERTCSVDGCDRFVLARGWCNAHYLKWRKYGDPTAVSVPVPKTCAAQGCDQPVHRSDLCRGHTTRRAYRWQPPKYRTTELLRRIDKSGDCWLWRGHIGAHGYGTFYFRHEVTSAHRAVFELYCGPIPDGLQLDHLCRVRHCVNPSHLEPVTARENILRGVAPTAANARKTHCDHGHEFTAENTITRKDGRECRTCRNERQRVLG